MSQNSTPPNLLLEEYLALPCPVEVHKDDSDGALAYVARVVELPGCIAQADNFEELEEMVQDTMRAWIESALEDGVSVPEPRQAEEYKRNQGFGKTLVSSYVKFQCEPANGSPPSAKSPSHS